MTNSMHLMVKSFMLKCKSLTLKQVKLAQRLSQFTLP